MTTTNKLTVLRGYPFNIVCKRTTIFLCDTKQRKSKDVLVWSKNNRYFTDYSSLKYLFVANWQIFRLLFSYFRGAANASTSPPVIFLSQRMIKRSMTFLNSRMLPVHRMS